MDTSFEARKQQASAINGGSVLGAITLAYFSQPLLKFANPSLIFSGGVLLAVGLLGGYFYLIVEHRPWLVRGFLFVCFLGVVLLIASARDALSVTQDNDERCILVEHDMFQKVPKIADAASVFSALGCRPATNFVGVLGDTDAEAQRSDIAQAKPKTAPAPNDSSAKHRKASVDRAKPSQAR